MGYPSFVLEWILALIVSGIPDFPPLIIFRYFFGDKLVFVETTK